MISPLPTSSVRSPIRDRLDNMTSPRTSSNGASNTLTTIPSSAKDKEKEKKTINGIKSKLANLEVGSKTFHPGGGSLASRVNSYMGYSGVLGINGVSGSRVGNGFGANPATGSGIGSIVISPSSKGNLPTPKPPGATTGTVAASITAVNEDNDQSSKLNLLKSEVQKLEAELSRLSRIGPPADSATSSYFPPQTQSPPHPQPHPPHSHSHSRTLSQPPILSPRSLLNEKTPATRTLGREFDSRSEVTTMGNPFGFGMDEVMISEDYDHDQDHDQDQENEQFHETVEVNSGEASPLLDPQTPQTQIFDDGRSPKSGVTYTPATTVAGYGSNGSRGSSKFATPRMGGGKEVESRVAKMASKVIEEAGAANVAKNVHAHSHSTSVVAAPVTVMTSTNSPATASPAQTGMTTNAVPSPGQVPLPKSAVSTPRTVVSSTAPTMATSTALVVRKKAQEDDEEKLRQARIARAERERREEEERIRLTEEEVKRRAEEELRIRNDEEIRVRAEEEAKRREEVERIEAERQRDLKRIEELEMERERDKELAEKESEKWRIHIEKLEKEKELREKELQGEFERRLREEVERRSAEAVKLALEGQGQKAKQEEQRKKMEHDKELREKVEEAKRKAAAKLAKAKELLKIEENAKKIAEEKLKSQEKVKKQTAQEQLERKRCLALLRTPTTVHLSPSVMDDVDEFPGYDSSDSSEEFEDEEDEEDSGRELDRSPGIGSFEVMEPERSSSRMSMSTAFGGMGPIGGASGSGTTGGNGAVGGYTRAGRGVEREEDDDDDEEEEEHAVYSEPETIPSSPPFGLEYERSLGTRTPLIPNDSSKMSGGYPTQGSGYGWQNQNAQQSQGQGQFGFGNQNQQQNQGSQFPFPTQNQNQQQQQQQSLISQFPFQSSNTQNHSQTAQYPYQSPSQTQPQSQAKPAPTKGVRSQSTPKIPSGMGSIDAIMAGFNRSPANPDLGGSFRTPESVGGHSFGPTQYDKPEIIVVAGSTISGHKIVQNLGTCYGTASVRCSPYENLPMLLSGGSESGQAFQKNGKREAIDELVKNAEGMGGNGVIELKFNAPFPNGDSQATFTARGIAVVIEPTTPANRSTQSSNHPDKSLSLNSSFQSNTFSKPGSLPLSTSSGFQIPSSGNIQTSIPQPYSGSPAVPFGMSSPTKSGFRSPSFGSQTPGFGQTPYMGNQTPGFGQTPYMGNQTPGFGSQTPYLGNTGSQTPGFGSQASYLGNQIPGYRAKTPGVPGFGSPATSGFGSPPTSGFGAPSSGFGAPTSGFGVPTSGFGAPTSGFGAPTSGFGAPSNLSNLTAGMGITSSGFGVPTSGFGAPVSRHPTVSPSPPQAKMSPLEAKLHAAAASERAERAKEASVDPWKIAQQTARHANSFQNHPKTPNTPGKGVDLLSMDDDDHEEEDDYYYDDSY